MKIVKIVIICLPLLFTGNVFALCTVTTTTVNFGNYNPILATATDSTGTIDVFCDVKSMGVITSIGVSPNSGVFSPRQMAFGLELMNYNVYTNKQRTSIWGDGTVGTSTVSNNIPANKTKSMTVYGRIPPGQDVSVGTFSETLTVTVTW
jgi:spore coat protein U-like protein